MDISVLAKHIRLKVDLNDAEMEVVASYFVEKELPKKTILFREGTIVDAIAFVVEGCLRSYSIDENGFEHILQFAPEGWWITDMLSVIKSQQSVLNVESVVDSKVLLIKRSTQDELFDKIPKMERFFRILTENALCATRQRVIEGMSLTAKDRYINFCDTYPETVVNSIPQKYVAAYIGVTPEFLSKMRSQLYRS